LRSAQASQWQATAQAAQARLQALESTHAETAAAAAELEQRAQAAEAHYRRLQAAVDELLEGRGQPDAAAGRSARVVDP
jgi:uncharacterized coiled-coil protein SlyX